MSDAPADKPIDSQPATPAAAPAPAPAAQTPQDGQPAAPAPDVPAKPATPATPASPLQGGAPEGDTPAATPAGAFPEDWRQQMAGDDKAFLKTLERFSSPSTFAKAYKDIRGQVSTGALKPSLKDGATEEQVAAWRADNGIPAAPNEYKIDLGNGQVIGEADKPVVEEFAKTAHEANMSTAQFNKALGWYYGYQDVVLSQQAEADKANAIATEEALRKEWGAGYRGELNGVSAFAQKTFGEELVDLIANARTPDGRLLGQIPQYVTALAQLARDINPMASLVPAGTADVQKAGDDRINEIREIMRSDTSERYYKNPEMQAEYLRLLQARDKLRA